VVPDHREAALRLLARVAALGDVTERRQLVDLRQLRRVEAEELVAADVVADGPRVEVRVLGVDARVGGEEGGVPIFALTTRWDPYPVPPSESYLPITRTEPHDPQARIGWYPTQRHARFRLRQAAIGERGNGEDDPRVPLGKEWIVS
jgi:hypothetical protein